MQRAAFIIPLLSALLLPGCVTRAHHDATLRDLSSARALNRRIEIVLVPDLYGLPGTEELERLDSEASP